VESVGPTPTRPPIRAVPFVFEANAAASRRPPVGPIASQTDIIRQIHTKLTVTVTGAEECQCMAWVYKLVQSPPSRTQALKSWRIQSRWGVP